MGYDVLLLFPLALLSVVSCALGLAWFWVTAGRRPVLGGAALTLGCVQLVALVGLMHQPKNIDHLHEGWSLEFATASEAWAVHDRRGEYLLMVAILLAVACAGIFLLNVGQRARQRPWSYPDWMRLAFAVCFVLPTLLLWTWSEPLRHRTWRADDARWSVGYVREWLDEETPPTHGDACLTYFDLKADPVLHLDVDTTFASAEFGDWYPQAAVRCQAICAQMRTAGLFNPGVLEDSCDAAGW